MQVVSFAAVFWDVTQCSTLGGALRDIPKNGCEGDYRAGELCVKSTASSDQRKLKTSFISQPRSQVRNVFLRTR